MKDLKDYDTPITNAATCGIVDLMGAHTELTNPKVARDLEQRLMMALEGLRELLYVTEPLERTEFTTPFVNARQVLALATPPQPPQP